MSAPVVFDLDGTLIDSLPGITGAANALLDEEGLPPLGSKQVAGFVGRGEQVFLDRLIAATALDPQTRDSLMPRFIAHYERAARGTRLFDGVAGMLDAFDAAGVAMGLCTNKPAAPLAPVLEETGLSGRFAVVVAGDAMPRRKPDPAPLLHAFEVLGQGPGLYVGDSEVDAETAERAGIPFALFTEGIRQAAIADIPHQAAFNDFSELPAIRARLCR
jgi:phosphoglycolate phosphatase